MSIGGQGPMAIGLLWMMVGISLPLALLRYYTRKWVTNSVAMDDYIYSIGWLCLLLYVLFMTISGIYGFGQDINNLSQSEASLAFMWEIVAQCFTVIGMGFAKTSNALFLLRLVIQKWHMWFLKSIIILHAFFCSLTVIMLWVQCIPAAAIWDPSVEGNCTVRDSHAATNISIFTGSLFVAADFIFAIFPWIYIWNLQMRRKEKFIIAGSMSLSVFAGICGIFRSLTMKSLSSPNYTLDTVPLVLLAAAEQAITMICIGIPQLRPLYRKAIKPWFRGESYAPTDEASRRRSKYGFGYARGGADDTENAFKLRESNNRKNGGGPLSSANRTTGNRSGGSGVPSDTLHGSFGSSSSDVNINMDDDKDSAVWDATVGGGASSSSNRSGLPAGSSGHVSTHAYATHSRNRSASRTRGDSQELILPRAASRAELGLDRAEAGADAEEQHQRGVIRVTDDVRVEVTRAVEAARLDMAAGGTPHAITR